MKKIIKAVLFDLDGTLLPMDQDVFVKAYFGGLSKKLAPLGYSAETLIPAIWQGTKAMVTNSGGKTNEEIFWDAFADILGEGVRGDEPYFEKYYKEDFDKVREHCGFDKRAMETVESVKSLGYRVILATNPIFPAIATEKRIRWAGLSPEDFEYYTTYENSRHSKPNPEYYKDILAHIGLNAEECLMVGNDVSEDMVARRLGMEVFLLTDCLINKGGEDISEYPRGSFGELAAFIENITEDRTKG